MAIGMRHHLARAGTRPARRTTSPPSVSTSSASSGVARRMPASASKSSRSTRACARSPVGLARPGLTLGLVMLVGDVAHDLFQQVLDGHEPIDPAIFVDHQRHMDMRRLHLLQKHADRHRGRGMSSGRSSLPGRRARPRAPKAVFQRQILQMNQAARLVERLGIDRQPRQGARLEGGDKRLDRGLIGDRDDLGAARHIVDPHEPEIAQIDQQAVRRAPAGRVSRILAPGLSLAVARNRREKKFDLAGLSDLRRRTRAARCRVPSDVSPMSPLSSSNAPGALLRRIWVRQTPMPASIFVSKASIASASSSARGRSRANAARHGPPDAAWSASGMPAAASRAQVP